DVDDDLNVEDDRRAGAAERQLWRVVYLGRVNLPVDFVGLRVIAGQDAADAVGVDLAAVHARSAARAVAEGDVGFLARIRCAPRGLAGLGVEDGKNFFVLAGGARVQIHFAAGDYGAAVSFADGLRPYDLEVVFPGLDYFFAGAVAIWPEPLRPIVGIGDGCECR